MNELIRSGQRAAALAAAADSTRRFPAHDGLALLHAKTLVLNGRNQEAANLLSNLDLLAQRRGHRMREPCFTKPI